MLQLKEVTVTSPAGETLFDGVNQVFSPGVTALIGPNGSGKSTLLRAIATIHSVVKGEIRIGEIDSQEERGQYLNRLAFLPQTFSAYSDLTGREFLEYSLRLRGTSRKKAESTASAWLHQVNLESVADERTQTYSQGMLQRLGLAYALQVDVDVYLLDEPFAGVDPESCQSVMETLFLLGRSKIILVSTHEIEAITRMGARVMRVHNQALE